MTDTTAPPDAGVTARPTGRGRFETAIHAGGASFLADEPAEVGGGGNGPTPFELLSAALAACTSMTLCMYAERKGWTLPPFTVEVGHSVVSDSEGGRGRDRFERYIAFERPLEAEAEAKLLEIAEKCPVHRTLIRGFEIATSAGPAAAAHPAGEPPEAHERQMEAACAD